MQRKFIINKINYKTIQVEETETVWSRIKMEPELIIIDVCDNFNEPLQYNNNDNNYNIDNYLSSIEVMDFVSVS